MTKTVKNSIINILIVLFAWVIPMYALRWYQDNYIDVEAIQRFVVLVVLFGSALLIYKNYKTWKKAESLKWLWVVFVVLGMLGAIYSLGILYLLFAFRHGIGF